MIENSVVSGRIVTLAATLYVARQVRSMTLAVWEAYVDYRIEAISDLHAAAYEAIETDFDFWWSDKPTKCITNRLLEGDVLPDEVKESGDLYDATRSILEDLQDKARHLAAHAYVGQVEHELIVSLPKFRGTRDTLLEQRKEHEAELDDERTLLIEAGLDVDELEARFVSSV